MRAAGGKLKRKKPMTRRQRTLDDSGFSEESPKDEKLFDRSYKINPTRGKRNPRTEVKPNELMFRRSRKIPRGT